MVDPGKRDKVLTSACLVLAAERGRADDPHYAAALETAHDLLDEAVKDYAEALSAAEDEER